MSQLTQDLKEALDAGSTWQGSPDALWQRVTEAAGRQQVCRPWRLPGWGLAAVAAAALTLWLIWPAPVPGPVPPDAVSPGTVPPGGVAADIPAGYPPGGIPHSPQKRKLVEPLPPDAVAKVPPPTATPAPATPGVTDKAEAQPEAPVRQAPPATPAPAPVLLEFSAAPVQADFAAGEPVRLQVRLRNVSGEVMQLEGTTPALVIGPMSEPYDNGNLAGEVITLPWLAGRTLAPGEEVAGEAVWQQEAPPGWYRAVFTGLNFQAGSHRGRMGGGEARFLIRYPAGEALVRTIEPGTEVSLGSYTLTVRRVEFSERMTRVYFHVTGLEAPGDDLVITLVRPDGTREGPFLGFGRRNSEDGIEGVAEFNPTAAVAPALALEVREVSVLGTQGRQRLSGPWRVEIPLGQE